MTNSGGNREEILRKLLDRFAALDERQFVHLGKSVLERAEGPASCEVLDEGAPGGLDIIGHVSESLYQGQFGFAVVQANEVGEEIVEEVRQSLEKRGCGFGSILTNGQFTEAARAAAHQSVNPSVKLIDGENLASVMISEFIGVYSEDGDYLIEHEFWTRFEKFDSDLIPSSAVPQADSFDVIEETISAVSEGNQYSPEIREYLIAATEDDWTRRQIHYYTLAAQSIGFLEATDGEYDGYAMRKWELTSKGDQLLDLDESNRSSFLRELIREMPIFELILAEMSDQKITQNDIKSIIRRETEVTGTTVSRRASTIRSWLRNIREVKINDQGLTTYEYYKRDLQSWADEEPET